MREPEDQNAPQESTGRLAKAVADGRLDCFQPLYERVAPSLFAWARLNILPELRQRVEPEDLVQEVWTRAFSNFDRFQPELGSFRAWIFGIAKLVLLEGLRNARRGGKQAGSAFDLAGVPQSVTAISTRLARDESIEQFLAAVTKLEREERQLVVYLGLEGLRPVDAAERLGLPYETITKRWQRLRARLRDQGVGADLMEASGT